MTKFMAEPPPEYSEATGYGCVLGHGDEAKTGLIRVQFRPVIKDGEWLGFGPYVPSEFLYFVTQVWVDDVMLAGEATLLVSLVVVNEKGQRASVSLPRLVWHPEDHGYRSESMHENTQDHLFMYSLGEAR